MDKYADKNILTKSNISLPTIPQLSIMIIYNSTWSI